MLLGVGVGLVEEQRVPMPGAASSWTDLVAGIGISALIGLGGLLIVAVVAESLAQRHRPATMAGVMDVVRGHVLVPEAAVAGVIGTAVALFMAGTDASVVAAVRGWADLPISGELPSALDLPAARWSPVVSMLLLPAMVVCLALPLLCAVLLLRHLRAPVPVALLAPALVVGAFSNFGVMAPQGLLVVAATLVFTLVLWRWGLLAMMVAMLVATLVPEGLYLLRGDTPVLAGVGVAHLALAAVPLLLAVAAWRRAR